MKTQDIRKELAGKDAKALGEYVKEQREALRNERFSHAGAGTQLNVSEVKKNIARALTQLNRSAQ